MKPSLFWNKTLTTILIKSRSICSSANLRKLIEIADEADFHAKVLRGPRPIVVNFHAEWCEPCHILTPKLTKMFRNCDFIDLLTVDVEAHAQLAQTFEVKAVPAVIALKNGVIVDKFIGLVDGQMIENMVKTLMPKRK